MVGSREAGKLYPEALVAVSGVANAESRGRRLLGFSSAGVTSPFPWAGESRGPPSRQQSWGPGSLAQFCPSPLLGNATSISLLLFQIL